MAPLNLAPVADLVKLIQDHDVRAAQDPAGFVPPGVLVKLTGFHRYTLGDAPAPTVRVFAVVPDKDHARATKELVGLVDGLLELVDPDSDITATSVLLPNNPAPLPAMAFDLHLY